MKKMVYAVAALFLISCNGNELQEKNKAKGIVVGSSTSDNQKRLRETHPEVRKAIHNLLEKNKGNVPSVGPKNN